MRNHLVTISVMGVSVATLAGCWHQPAKVERWTDLEKPCQPHAFYVAPKGESLADVARICKADEALLRRHNAWLLTRQPFAESTVVWLKQNPAISPDEETLMVDAVVPEHRAMSSEQLSPLR